MLDLFNESQAADHQPPVSTEELNDEQVLTELSALKTKLADKVVFLGHHYQQDDIISYADITGDSLALAKKAQELDHPYVIFCGVHFMAETADMLCKEGQTVILPDLNAGCSMADMANREEVDKAWEFLTESTKSTITPITYINCSADLKAFVGENKGSICTSSNARKIIQWAFNQGEKLLFFPDQHLGRNTCHEMGIGLDEMVVYDPRRPNGGLTAEQVQKAKVILWYGHCSVHQGFTPDQIKQVKEKNPKTQVIVHPECSFDVVRMSDLNGSTAFIIETIEKAPAGSSFAVGTEINLVNRLAARFPDKEILSLSPYQCLCTTMYRVRPRWLLGSLRAIDQGSPINVIKVEDSIKRPALLALERMLNC